MKFYMQVKQITYYFSVIRLSPNEEVNIEHSCQPIDNSVVPKWWESKGTEPKGTGQKRP